MRLTRLAPAVFVILWSAGFAFVALGLPDSEPLTFLALRYAAVVVLLAAAFVLLRPPLPVGRAGWLALVTGGVLVQGLYFALLYLALDLRLAAGTVALVVSLQPVLVAVASPRVTGDRVGPSRWIGLLIGLLGAVLVIVAQDRVSPPAGRYRFVQSFVDNRAAAVGSARDSRRSTVQAPSRRRAPGCCRAGRRVASQATGARPDPRRPRRRHGLLAAAHLEP